MIKYFTFGERKKLLASQILQCYCIWTPLDNLPNDPRSFIQFISSLIHISCDKMLPLSLALFWSSFSSSNNLSTPSKSHLAPNKLIIWKCTRSAKVHSSFISLYNASALSNSCIFPHGFITMVIISERRKNPALCISSNTSTMFLCLLFLTKRSIM